MKEFSKKVKVHPEDITSKNAKSNIDLGYKNKEAIMYFKKKNIEDQEIDRKRTVMRSDTEKAIQNKDARRRSSLYKRYSTKVPGNGKDSNPEGSKDLSSDPYAFSSEIAIKKIEGLQFDIEREQEKGDTDKDTGRKFISDMKQVKHGEVIEEGVENDDKESNDNDEIESIENDDNESSENYDEQRYSENFEQEGDESNKSKENENHSLEEI